MGVITEKIDALLKKKEKTLQMGGAKGIESQKSKGKMTARERLNQPVDLAKRSRG